MESKRKRSAKSESNLDECKEKKLKKIASSAAQNDECNYNFDRLPPEILLHIFQYLNSNDLCKSASVCKNWRKTAYDETLWYHIDLSKLNIDIKRLWKFIRQPYVMKAKSIEIHGSLRKQSKGFPDRIITPAFMTKLNDTCKNLTIIRLKYVDLNLITVHDLPKNIKELYLIRCEVPRSWFEKNNFNQLQILDFSDSAAICSKHIADVVNNCKNTLKRLILSSCYRIDDRAIEIITKEFLSLNCLKIDGTLATDLALHWICTRLKNLEELDISNCKSIKEADLDFIKESYKHIDEFKFSY